MRRCLVGDIGGTHCRLALAHISAERIELSHRHTYLNAEFDHLAALIRHHLAGLAGVAAPDSVCLAVAGPTEGGGVAFTNLDWRLNATALARELELTSLRFINDFVAVGLGLAALGDADRIALQAGRPDPGAPCLALGPGTGLGVVQCFPAKDRPQVHPSEGGHIGFAPVDAEQIRLLAFMQAELGGRVSIERILSGPGIEALYRFRCLETGRAAPPLAASAVSAAALASPPDPGALAALRLFARILGQTAGDLALVSRASGGVYIAGGIAPRILPILQDGGLLAGFHAKGRFSSWMRALPLHIVTDPDIGLKGAALAA